MASTIKEAGDKFPPLSESRAGPGNDEQVDVRGVGHVGLEEEAARIGIMDEHASFVGVAGDEIHELD